MSDLYTRMAITTLIQIEEKGRNVTLVSPASGGYNPNTGVYTPPVSSEKTVKGVFTSFKANEIDGEKIRRDDRRILIASASLTTEPKTTDKIKDNGLELSIVNVETVMPGNVPLLYKVQVRR